MRAAAPGAVDLASGRGGRRPAAERAARLRRGAVHAGAGPGCADARGPRPAAAPAPRRARRRRGRGGGGQAAEPGPSGWNPERGLRPRVGGRATTSCASACRRAYKVEPIYQDGDFRDRRAFFVLRPIFAGNFFKDWIRFWTSLELNSNPPYLLDSYVEINPIEEFGARIGQQYTLISRHEQFGPAADPVPRVVAGGRVLLDRARQGRHRSGASSPTSASSTTPAPTPARRCASSRSHRRQLRRRGAARLEPAGRRRRAPSSPTSATRRRPSASRGSVQGYYGKVQLAEENFNPSSFRFDVMPTGDGAQAGLRGGGLLDPGAAGSPPRPRATCGDTDPEAATPARYTSVGVWGQIGFLLLPRTLDIGCGSTGSTPAPTSATTTSSRARCSSPTT